jgi:hypothetical protein
MIPIILIILIFLIYHMTLMLCDISYDKLKNKYN